VTMLQEPKKIIPTFVKIESSPDREWKGSVLDKLLCKLVFSALEFPQKKRPLGFARCREWHYSGEVGIVFVYVTLWEIYSTMPH